MSMTKREVMVAVMSGELVDCDMSGGRFWQYSPIHWNEEQGLVNLYGGTVYLDDLENFRPHKKRRTVEVDFWVKVYMDSSVRGCYISKAEAEESLIGSLSRDEVIAIINIKQIVTEET